MASLLDFLQNPANTQMLLGTAAGLLGTPGNARQQFAGGLLGGLQGAQVGAQLQQARAAEEFRRYQLEALRRQEAKEQQTEQAYRGLFGGVTSFGDRPTPENAQAMQQQGPLAGLNPALRQFAAQVPASVGFPLIANALKPQDQPAVVRQYELAKQQGFKGTLLEFQQELAKASQAPTADPSAVREYQFFQSLPPEKQQQFINVKRAGQNVDLGYGIGTMNPAQPGEIMAVNPKGIAPERRVDGGTQYVLPPVVPGNSPQIAPGAVPTATPLPMTREETQGQEAKVLTADQMLRSIENVLSDKYLPFSTGVASIATAIPGTPMYDFRQKVDQLKGQAFLQAFETLKGGGQITQVEGEKATQAIGRLNTAQSPSAFREALQELKGVVESAKSRAQKKAGGEPTAPAPANSGNKRIRFDAQGNMVQ